MLPWLLGVLTMAETLNRSPVSPVPSERAGSLAAESPFTDPTPPGVQQGCYKLAVLTFSPGFRPKHTLQPAHPCFAGHSPQDEILMAS